MPLVVDQADANLLTKARARGQYTEAFLRAARTLRPKAIAELEAGQPDSRVVDDWARRWRIHSRTIIREASLIAAAPAAQHYARQEITAAIVAERLAAGLTGAALTADPTYGERLSASIVCLTRGVERATEVFGEQISQTSSVRGRSDRYIPDGLFDGPHPLIETRAEYLRRCRRAWALSKKVLKPAAPPNLQLQAEWAVRYFIKPTEKVSTIARDSHRSIEAVRSAISTFAQVLGLRRRPRGRPRKPPRLVRPSSLNP